MYSHLLITVLFPISSPLKLNKTDLKPKLKNHYRAHRLSFWLNLVPDLHRPGNDDVPNSHHQLVNDDFDRPETATVKPLNPPKEKDNEITSNYSIHTPFTVLNLTSNNHRPNSAAKAPNLDGSGAAADDDTNSGASNQSEDGFAAYSTALSVTIAIGCSLLILNVLIFAGVYYQRDKTRMNEPRNGGNSLNMSHQSVHSVLKKRNENGQLPNNICGEMDSLTIHSKSDPSTILAHHHTLHHQMPPPEFADIPQRAPPPPKHMKSILIDSGHGGSGMGGMGMNQPAAGPVMATHGHAMQMMGSNCTGTMQKKGCVKNSNSGANSQCHAQNPMDELRV